MRKPFYKRWFFWVPVAIVLLLVVLSFLIDPIATHYARENLKKVKGFESDLEAVHVSLLRLNVAVDQIKMTETPVTPNKKPLLYVKHIEASVLWKELIKFRLTANAQVRGMKVSAYVSQPEIEKAKEAAKKVIEMAPPWEDVPEALKTIFPFKVARLEIREGEFLLVGRLKESNTEIWLHDVEMSLENFANRTPLQGGRPATLALRGKLMSSGVLTIFATTDILLHPPAFAGQAELKDFNLHDVEPVFTTFTGLKMVKGTFSAYTVFKSEDNKIEGGVKPVLKNVDLAAPADGDIVKKIEAAFGDAALGILSDRVPGRNAVMTEIPITGHITNPDIQVIPAIMGIVRNAFVIGLAESFANVPPRQAPKDENIFVQAKDALSANRVSPKTQPKDKK